MFPRLKVLLRCNFWHEIKKMLHNFGIILQKLTWICLKNPLLHWRNQDHNYTPDWNLLFHKAFLTLYFDFSFYKKDFNSIILQSLCAISTKLPKYYCFQGLIHRKIGLLKLSFQILLVWLFKYKVYFTHTSVLWGHSQSTLTEGREEGFSGN